MKNNPDKQIQNSKKYLKNTLLILAIFSMAGLIYSGLWINGLFQKPDNWKPVSAANDAAISQYLSNYIIPQLHNKSQYDKPFDLTIPQAAVDDIIAHHIDTEKLASAGLYEPSITVSNNGLRLSAKTTYKNSNFFVSLTVIPKLDQTGKLLLAAENFRIGNSKLPFVAEKIKKQILLNLQKNISGKESEFLATLLAEGSAKPKFKLNGNQLSIADVNIYEGNMTLKFVPER